MFAATAQYAREVIHAFNDKGFAALDPKWNGGRPPKFGPHVRELVCRVARTPPQQAGRPFTTWSLSKLAEHLRKQPGTAPDRDQHRHPAQDPAPGRGALAGHQETGRDRLLGRPTQDPDPAGVRPRALAGKERTDDEVRHCRASIVLPAARNLVEGTALQVERAVGLDRSGRWSAVPSVAASTRWG